MNPFNDEYFMKQALVEARAAASEGEVPVGAVIVCNNQIIARAHNQTECLNDVTAHAEMLAITAATGVLGAKYLTNCSLYVTVEPCIMCAGAIGWAQARSYTGHPMIKEVSPNSPLKPSIRKRLSKKVSLKKSARKKCSVSSSKDAKLYLTSS